MPTYVVTDPATGRKVRLTGDSPPTDTDLDEIFSSLPAPPQKASESAAPLASPVAPQDEQINLDVPSPEQDAILNQYYSEQERLRASQPSPSFIDKAIGFGEAGLGLLTSATGGTVGLLGGSIGGVAGNVLSGQYGTQEGADLAEETAIDSARRFTYEPRGALGGQYLQNIGEAFAPLAGIAPLTPQISATTSAIRNAPSVVARAPLQSKSIDRSVLREATPTIEQLKQGARDIYKEIDDLGATVKKDSVQAIASDLNATMRQEGFNRRIHPKVSAALQEFNVAAKKDQPLSNIDTLRRIAGAAASSAEPDEARLGRAMTNKIDSYLDELSEESLSGGEAANVGQKYRDARQLWQRSRKAEEIDYLLERAKNQATGEENGLRIQFRSLLNNKKKIKAYTPDEVAAMQKVVQGGGVENTLKLLGKFGFSEGQAVRMLIPSLGAAGGAAVGGGAGAVAVPLIGQVSRNLAQKMTRNNADMVSQIVRAGRNGDSIARAYFAAVPKGQRSPYELSELLMAAGASMPKAKLGNKELNNILAESAILINAVKPQTKEDEENE
jgi:hypothetical protein